MYLCDSFIVVVVVVVVVVIVGSIDTWSAGNEIGFFRLLSIIHSRRQQLQLDREKPHGVPQSDLPDPSIFPAIS